MAVAAKINKLPVLVTDEDVNQEEEVQYEIELDISDFEMCCGCIEVGRAEVFRGGSTTEFVRVPPEASHAMLKELERLPSSNKDKGLATYTLDDLQKVEAQCLIEAGFQVMAEFRNPGTGNRVTMYGLLMNQPRQQPVAKKAKKKVRR